QICIRYILQRNVLPIPKSTHDEFIIENTKVDFEISQEDMDYLNG
ncbi:MAG: aldo/keto reductase, partial [Saccharofermentanales bacterium]